MEQILQDYLYYLIAHQKKMFSGLRRVSYPLLNLFKTLGSKIKNFEEMKKDHKEDSDNELSKETNRFLKK